MANLLDTWNDLPKGGKIAIGVGAGAAVILGLRAAMGSRTVVSPSPTALVPADSGGKVGDADVAAQLNAAMAALTKSMDDRFVDLQNDVAGSIGIVNEALKNQANQTNTAIGQISSSLSGTMSQVGAINNDLLNQLDGIKGLAQQAYDKASSPAPVSISTPSIPKVEEKPTSSKPSTSSGSGVVPTGDSFKWSVDSSGNIYKDNRYIAVSASNKAYVPDAVIKAAQQVKASK